MVRVFVQRRGIFPNPTFWYILVLRRIVWWRSIQSWAEQDYTHIRFWGNVFSDKPTNLFCRYKCIRTWSESQRFVFPRNWSESQGTSCPTFPQWFRGGGSFFATKKKWIATLDTLASPWVHIVRFPIGRGFLSHWELLFPGIAQLVGPEYSSMGW